MNTAMTVPGPAGSAQAGNALAGSALDVPEQVRQNQLKDNTGGWSQELGSLRKRAEEPAPA